VVESVKEKTTITRRFFPRGLAQVSIPDFLDLPEPEEIEANAKRMESS